MQGKASNVKNLVNSFGLTRTRNGSTNTLPWPPLRQNNANINTSSSSSYSEVPHDQIIVVDVPGDGDCFYLALYGAAKQAGILEDVQNALIGNKSPTCIADAERFTECARAGVANAVLRDDILTNDAVEIIVDDILSNRKNAKDEVGSIYDVYGASIVEGIFGVNTSLPNDEIISLARKVLSDAIKTPKHWATNIDISIVSNVMNKLNYTIQFSNGFKSDQPLEKGTGGNRQYKYGNVHVSNTDKFVSFSSYNPKNKTYDMVITPDPKVLNLIRINNIHYMYAYPTVYGSISGGRHVRSKKPAPKKKPAAPTWVATGRKVEVQVTAAKGKGKGKKQGSKSTSKKTVYMNSKTKELRVRSLRVSKDGKTRTYVYVKF